MDSNPSHQDKLELTYFGQPYMPSLDQERGYTLPSSRVRSGPTRLIVRPDPSLLRQSKLHWLELRLNQAEVKNNLQLWNTYVQELQVVLGPEQGKTEVLTTIKRTEATTSLIPISGK